MTSVLARVQVNVGHDVPETLTSSVHVCTSTAATSDAMSVLSALSLAALQRNRRVTLSLWARTAPSSYSPATNRPPSMTSRRQARCPTARPPTYSDSPVPVPNASEPPIEPETLTATR